VQLTEFEALSFDCYGTLIDWESGLGAVLGAWASRQGLPVDLDELLTSYGAQEAAAEAGLPTVWINRRRHGGGWGATPAPVAPVTPDWEFPSLAAFADAVDGE
jgi:2-haloacid dehalogenase